MNNIHRKSGLSGTAAIISAAHEQGENLVWDRYEQQVPLCSFTSNGLSCRKCFQGPCRINPFGDEPSLGICGADREQIVMENLFQTTMRGVFETAQVLAGLDQSAAREISIDIEKDLPPDTLKKYTAKGMFPICKEQLFQIQNSFFSHKDFLGRTLDDLMRLGLIHYGLIKQIGKAAVSCADIAASYDPSAANVLVFGQPPLALIESLQKKPVRGKKGISPNLLVQGSKVFASGLPLADHGHAELALMMNTDALLIAPDAAEPSLTGLAKRLGIPVFLIDQAKPMDKFVAQVSDAAFLHKRNSGGTALPQQFMAPEYPDHAFSKQRTQIKKAIETGDIRGILVILGGTNVKKTFFEKTLVLLEKMMHRPILVLLGGELGANVGLLKEELARRLGIHRFDNAKKKQQDIMPLLHFGFEQIPMVVESIRQTGSSKRFGKIPAAISFPEFSHASTWATAVSFLSLGFAVQIGSPLPFWGSPSLSEILLQQWPAVSGGRLLASVSEMPAEKQANDIIALFRDRSLKKK